MLQPSPTKSTVKAVVKSPTKRVEFKKTKRDIEIEKTNKGNASGVRAKSGTTMKKAKSGFAALAPPFDKATFADKIAGAKKNAGKAKSGAKMAKQAAVAIAMKKAGKTPKKAMNGYGGAAASMVPMKNGGKMKKAQTGTVSKKFDRPDSKDTKPVFSEYGVGKDVPAKNGKSMKKCKYGCK